MVCLGPALSGIRMYCLLYHLQLSASHKQCGNVFCIIITINRLLATSWPTELLNGSFQGTEIFRKLTALTAFSLFS